MTRLIKKKEWIRYKCSSGGASPFRQNWWHR